MHPLPPSVEADFFLNFGASLNLLSFWEEFEVRLKYFCSALRLTQIFEKVSINIEPPGLTLRCDRPGQFSARENITHNLLDKIRSKNSPASGYGLTDTELIEALSIALKERFASGQIPEPFKGVSGRVCPGG